MLSAALASAPQVLAPFGCLGVVLWARGSLTLTLLRAHRDPVPEPWKTDEIERIRLDGTWWCKEVGCVQQATFGKLTDDKPSHCSKHASKEAGDLDLTNPRCQMPNGTCKQRAVFKETGHKQPSRCVVHKKDGMERMPETSHSVRFANDLRRVWHFISGEDGADGEVSDDDNEVETIEQLAAPEDEAIEQLAAPEDVMSGVSEDDINTKPSYTESKLTARSVIKAVNGYANGDSLDGVPHPLPPRSTSRSRRVIHLCRLSVPQCGSTA